jgi:hypothetical protein
MASGSPKGCPWQKPRNYLVFNCPDLKVGAIDIRDIHGFSHNNKICGTLLERTLLYFSENFLKHLKLQLPLPF